MRQQEVNMKISTEVIIALLASFAISVVLSPIIIPFLKRLKIGQTERTEGVQSHLEKAGTPTRAHFSYRNKQRLFPPHEVASLFLRVPSTHHIH